MVKMRLTLIVEYDANPELFPKGTTPDDMAKIDEENIEENINEDPGIIFGLGDFDLKVEPV